MRHNVDEIKMTLKDLKESNQSPKIQETLINNETQCVDIKFTSEISSKKSEAICYESSQGESQNPIGPLNALDNKSREGKELKEKENYESSEQKLDKDYFLEADKYLEMYLDKKKTFQPDQFPRYGISEVGSQTDLTMREIDDLYAKKSLNQNDLMLNMFQKSPDLFPKIYSRYVYENFLFDCKRTNSNVSESQLNQSLAIGAYSNNSNPNLSLSNSKNHLEAKDLKDLKDPKGNSETFSLSKNQKKTSKKQGILLSQGQGPLGDFSTNSFNQINPNRFPSQKKMDLDLSLNNTNNLSFNNSLNNIGNSGGGNGNNSTRLNYANFSKSSTAKVSFRNEDLEDKEEKLLSRKRKNPLNYYDFNKNGLIYKNGFENAYASNSSNNLKSSNSDRRESNFNQVQNQSLNIHEFKINAEEFSTKNKNKILIKRKIDKRKNNKFPISYHQQNQNASNIRNQNISNISNALDHSNPNAISSNKPHLHFSKKDSSHKITENSKSKKAENLSRNISKEKDKEKDKDKDKDKDLILQERNSNKNLNLSLNENIESSSFNTSENFKQKKPGKKQQKNLQIQNLKNLDKEKNEKNEKNSKKNLEGNNPNIISASNNEEFSRSSNTNVDNSFLLRNNNSNFNILTDQLANDLNQNSSNFVTFDFNSNEIPQQNFNLEKERSIPVKIKLNKVGRIFFFF